MCSWSHLFKKIYCIKYFWIMEKVSKDLYWFTQCLTIILFNRSHWFLCSAINQFYNAPWMILIPVPIVVNNACFSTLKSPNPIPLQYKCRSIHRNHGTVICCTLHQLLTFKHSWHNIVTHFDWFLERIPVLIVYHETHQVEGFHTVLKNIGTPNCCEELGKSSCTHDLLYCFESTFPTKTPKHPPLLVEVSSIS